MTDNAEKLTTEVLRIALDQKATQAFASMTARMKETKYPLKLTPSQFVSFLVADFFDTYFDDDIDVLVAEFFDSHKFLTLETQSAKGKDNFEEVMRSALVKAEKIKGKRRGNVRNLKSRKMNRIATEHEKT